MKTAIKTFIAISASLIGIGIVLCFIGFSMAGFSFQKLSNSPQYKQEVQSFSAKDITLIKTDLDNESIIIKASSGDEIVLTYFTNENRKINCEESSGKIILSSQNSPFEWFKPFSFTSIGNLINSQKKIVIEIPKGYEKELDIKTSNGSITLNEDFMLSTAAFQTKNSSINLSKITCEDLVASTTNGSITIKDIKVEKDIDATTTNSSIRINSCTAVKFKAQTNNGDIKVDDLVAGNSIDFKTGNADILAYKIDCGDISFVTSNGDVVGSLLSPQHEYSIRSRTSNGDSNIAESSKGSTGKELYVHTSNADIEITFDD